MAPRTRRNPLALAVLISLAERPMHPYEVATVLRQRQKHESVRLNYGSLYAVIASLEKRGLIAPHETERAGRLPERTVYRVTDAGLIEMQDWLTELLSTPVNDYPTFEAALSFLPALPPEHVVTLLRERLGRLEFLLAESAAANELAQKYELPRIFWIEHEFQAGQRQAELEFVRRLIHDIESGHLDGVDWWRAIHSDDADRSRSPHAGWPHPHNPSHTELGAPEEEP